MADLWHSYKQQGLLEEETTVTKLDEVLKRYDSGATRSEMNTAFSLLPWDALQAAAKVMKDGAKTHGKHNWKNGFPIDEGMDHVLEHLSNYMQGADDGVDHLAHAICGLLMVKSFDLKGEKFHDGM